MPDEDGNVTGISQTSSAQSGDDNDFVIDFGEGSNIEDINTSEKSENPDSSTDNSLDENKNGENEKDNISIQDLDTIFSENQNEGFDISLGNDMETEDKNGTIERINKLEDNLTGIDEVKENEEKNQETESQEVVKQDDMNEDAVEEVFDDEITGEKLDENDTLPSEDVEDKEEIKEKSDNEEFADTTIQTNKISNNFVEDINMPDNTNEEIENDSVINEDESEEGVKDIQNLEEKSVDQNEEMPDTNTDLIDNEKVLENDNQEAVEEIQGTNNSETDLFLDSDLFQEDVSSDTVVNSENNNENVDLQEEDKEEDIEDKEQQNAENVNMDLSTDSLEENSENEPEISDNGEGNIQSETKIEDKEIEAQEKKPDNLDFVMDFNLEKETPQQEIKQPEIGDLMGDMNMDFSLDEPTTSEENTGSQVDESFDTVENITNSVMENINNAENTNLEATNSEMEEELEINIPNPANLTDVTMPKVEIQNQNIEKKLGNDMGNQEKSDLLQSGESSMSQEIPPHDSNNQPKIVIENNTNQQPIIEENNATAEFNLQESQAEQINNLNEVKNNIDEASVPEKVEDNLNKPVKGQDVATLSLDQILDSELNSNPQYADNSKAVPKNVPSNSFSSKKTVGIIVGVLLLGLAGYVAVLAFPSKNTDRKPLDVVPNTGDQDHYAGYNPTEPEEYPEIEETETNTGNSGINPVKTQVSFPDVEGGDGESGSEEPEYKEPEPYYCTDEDCLEDPEIEVTTDKLTVAEVTSIISDYKLSAEKYYSLGDEYQDKKLIKYALQIINLCDSYQSQIESEEGATQESLDDFKSQFKTLMSKMEKYAGGGEEVQTFTQSNFNEEYNFEGKDELKEYINNRDNY